MYPFVSVTHFPCTAKKQSQESTQTQSHLVFLEVESERLGLGQVGFGVPLSVVQLVDGGLDVEGQELGHLLVDLQLEARHEEVHHLEWSITVTQVSEQTSDKRQRVDYKKTTKKLMLKDKSMYLLALHGEEVVHALVHQFLFFVVGLG